MMNAFQTCPNTSDAVPLFLPLQLYLKPIARLDISLKLPNVKKSGKIISHREIMEQIRTLIKPDQFTVFKVTNTTLEYIKFQAELPLKAKLEKVLSKLDNKSIKLKDFSEPIRLRALETKSDFPTKRQWDSFFHEAKDMQEMKPGERPDTIFLSKVPTKWFSTIQSADEPLPSEKLLYRVFEKFGTIRFVDIPICDPYRQKMKEQISGLKRINGQIDKEFFDGFVQFKDYIGFARAMDALKNMQLIKKPEDGTDEAQAISIKVDFDRTKHLSDASMRRREIVRDRLVKKTREKEEKDKQLLEEQRRKEELDRQKEVDVKAEKELRRKLREEKRKAKILEKLEVVGSDEINEKIAREEKKLVKVQRKLEAIRLVEELFRRVQEKQLEENTTSHKSKASFREGEDEIRKFKRSSELEVLDQREKLHHVVKGRAMLKSIISKATKSRSRSSSSGSSDHQETTNEFNNLPTLYDPFMFGYPYQGYYPPAIRGMYNLRGRPPRFNPGSSRGSYPRRGRYRGGNYRQQPRKYYPPEIEDEYRKYFSKFLPENDRRSRSRSYSRSRSRSTRSRSSSRRRSRRRTRSYSSRSRSKSRERQRSRRSRTKSKSRSRSRSIDSSKFMTPKQLAASRSARSTSTSQKGNSSRRRSSSRDKGSKRSLSPRTPQR